MEREYTHALSFVDFCTPEAYSHVWYRIGGVHMSQVSCEGQLCDGCGGLFYPDTMFAPVPPFHVGDRYKVFCKHKCRMDWINRQSVRATHMCAADDHQIPLSFT